RLLRLGRAEPALGEGEDGRREDAEADDLHRPRSRTAVEEGADRREAPEDEGRAEEEDERRVARAEPEDPGGARERERRVEGDVDLRPARDLAVVARGRVPLGGRPRRRPPGVVDEHAELVAEARRGPRPADEVAEPDPLRERAVVRAVPVARPEDRRIGRI